MDVLVIVRLSNAKARDHIMPLIEADHIGHVTLVRHAPVDIQSGKLTQHIHNSGLDDGTGKMRLLSSLKNLWLCFFNGLKIARSRSQPEMVIAFNFVPYGLIAWSVARLARIKVTVGLIGTDFNLRLKAGFFAPFFRVILRNCDSITIFSEEAKRALMKDGIAEEVVFILPHAIDTDLYSPDLSSDTVADLIYVGYLRQLKRVDRILLVMKHILEVESETLLWIVGDGPARSELEQLAQDLDIAKSVNFIGWSTVPVEYLRKARVFISLSDYEGLPMSTIEALCTGLPVVVSNVGALGTLIDDGINGYLVTPSEDPSQAADRILRILTDPTKYQQMRSAALVVRESYTYHHASSTWESVVASYLRFSEKDDG